MSGYFSVPIDLPEGYVTGCEINVPALTAVWRDNESQIEFERKLSEMVLNRARAQISFAAELRRQILTPEHHVNPDRAFTYLMRYQILGENYSDIAANPQKYREEPDDQEQHQVPNIKRDIIDAARQVGLEPRPSRRPGRPPNTKERGIGRRRAKRRSTKHESSAIE